MENATDIPADPARLAILEAAESLRWQVAPEFHEKWLESVYGEAAAVAGRNVARTGESRRIGWERTLDWLLTSRWTGFPMMVFALAVVLWLTIEGANVPSQMISSVLIAQGQPFLKGLADAVGMPWWLSGLLVDGMYLTTAWVISVMLPPMAIFFPLFTILEDFGYLPRVAFNLDRLFQKVGAHGKQALTMCMGLGCNAAGVIATRVIDSPRERLIAIVTNNFALCNGRWPTQILIATIFVGTLVPGAMGGLVAAGTVTLVATVGVVLTLGSSWLMAKTLLKGEASTFSLELPPYRPPRILHTLYTSLIDRTIFVLWRAVLFALPAGAAIWLIANIHVGGVSIAVLSVDFLDPFAWWLGLTGVILVAYVVAIPANEIVIPTVLMLTVLTTGVTGVGEQGAGVMFETSDTVALQQLLHAGGWTMLTALCLLLFSLCHNPCSTTIYTIYKETGSAKWTAVAAFFPLLVGIVLCAAFAFVWRLFV